MDIEIPMTAYCRRSMTLAQAESIVSHSLIKSIPEATVAEARLVVKSGEYWVWG